MAANPMPNSQLSDNMKKPGFADWGDPFQQLHAGIRMAQLP